MNITIFGRLAIVQGRWNDLRIINKKEIIIKNYNFKEKKKKNEKNDKGIVKYEILYKIEN